MPGLNQRAIWVYTAFRTKKSKPEARYTIKKIRNPKCKMNAPLSVSLVLTTYNWPEALRLTLQSVLNQSRHPDEVIVADDGSGPKTAQVVKEILKPSHLRWRHVWHQDLSVRQSRIKNLAVKNSFTSYLIFIDHDTVLHPEFIADHLSMAEMGTFLQGKRTLLSKAFTAKVLAERYFKKPGYWTGGLGNRKNAFRVPLLGKVFSGPKKFETSLRGCNLSLFKRDFFEVDGFDEVFDQSWGREDSDICYRLFHAGLRVKNLWFLALQYHLYHGVTADWEKERLDQELQRNQQEKRVKAVKGLSQISSEGEIIAASEN